MNEEYIIISKDGGHYSAEQAINARPMTAGELRDILSGVDDETPVIIYEGGYGVTHYAAHRAEVEYLEEEN